MGLGGDLLWTGVFEALDRNNKKGFAVHTPLITDLLLGYLFCRGVDLSKNPVFFNNKFVNFFESEPKSQFEEFIDWLFLCFLGSLSARELYEKWVFLYCKKRMVKRGDSRTVLVHVDMRIHSYGSSPKNRKIIWNKNSTAAAALARHFQLPIVPYPPSIFFTAKENDSVTFLLKSKHIQKSFIVFDPYSNQEWFGDLRQWKTENWKLLISLIMAKYPNIDVVRIGVCEGQFLDGVIDVSGLTTFREAAAIIERSIMFIGTEGGLMHAAAALNARSVILWGGVSDPKFAGYPEKHKIIFKGVPCAPCGNLGWCDNNKTCMSSITVNEVYSAVEYYLLQE